MQTNFNTDNNINKSFITNNKSLYNREESI